MKTQPTSKVPPCDLSSLSRVQLDARYSALLEAATASCGGAAPWRHRKLAEAHDLCRLAQISNRLIIMGLDLSVDLRADLLMRVTVPCLPDPAGSLKVADSARLGIIYRHESMMLPQPGFSFVQILAPQHVWHANVSPDHIQALCLGPLIPAGFPLRELVLLTYQALTMCAIQISSTDSAGVLNPAAGDWFQRNLRLVPLSREPFLQSH